VFELKRWRFQALLLAGARGSSEPQVVLANGDGNSSDCPVDTKLIRGTAITGEPVTNRYNQLVILVLLAQ